MAERKTLGVQVLDCTLRDGGYYNEWDFSTALVQEYIDGVYASGIRLLELGFRQLAADRYLGPLAYTTDSYIDSLRVPEDLVLGVMIDAKHALGGSDPGERVRLLFRKASDSKVRLVRIAAHFSEVQSLGPVVEALHERGYQVGLNLMQISSRTADEVRRFGELATEFRVEVAYFADSFGGMQVEDVSAVMSALRSTWSGPIGCHMHDNMTFALANTLAAVGLGATWVDGTVLGMGRGPGNARVEYLAIELTRRGYASYDHLPLIQLVQGSFASLRGTFGWGTNAYYFLSAARGIHPTYIQELTSDGRYGIKEVVTALESLRDGLGSSFTAGKLMSALAPVKDQRPTGMHDVSGWCQGRDVLIVGPGPAGLARQAEVQRYIKDTEPVVMALNIQPPIDERLVDAFVVCHPVRALMDAEKIALASRPVFAPKEVVDRVNGAWDHVDVMDYGLRIVDDQYTYSGTGCVLPQLETVAYALAVAAAGGARRVLLSGFDGFPPGDPRQETMSTLFDQFTQIPGAPPVVAVTRTSYSIRQSSIFAPLTPSDDA